MSREIEVWADWQELGSPTRMGRLHSSITRGREIFSFFYEDAWLANAAYDLNPAPTGAGLSLNISETDNSLSFDLALEVAPYFGNERFI